MKNIKLLLLAGLLFFSGRAVQAQTNPKEQRKIERAEKKRQQEAEAQRNRALVLEMLKEQTYVLEATTLSGRYRQHYVNPSTNFIKVEGDQVIIQTANDHSLGYNGLGGITLRGTINGYEVSKDKRGASVFIQFHDPVLGLSSLNMTVQSNGRARATVQGNWGQRASFNGELVGLEEARIFKGHSII